MAPQLTESLAGGIAPLSPSNLLVVVLFVLLAVGSAIFFFSPRQGVPIEVPSKKKVTSVPRATSAAAVGGTGDVLNERSTDVSEREGKDKGASKKRPKKLRFIDDADKDKEASSGDEGEIITKNLGEEETVRSLGAAKLNVALSGDFADSDSWYTVGQSAQNEGKEKKVREKKVAETAEQKAARLERERLRKAAAKQQVAEDARIARELQDVLFRQSSLIASDQSSTFSALESMPASSEKRIDSDDAWETAGKQKRQNLGLMTRDSLINLRDRQKHGQAQVQKQRGDGKGKTHDSVLDLAAKAKHESLGENRGGERGTRREGAQDHREKFNSAATTSASTTSATFPAKNTSATTASTTTTSTTTATTSTTTSTTTNLALNMAAVPTAAPTPAPPQPRKPIDKNPYPDPVPQSQRRSEFQPTSIARRQLQGQDQDQAQAQAHAQARAQTHAQGQAKAKAQVQAQAQAQAHAQSQAKTQAQAQGKVEILSLAELERRMLVGR